MSAPALSVETQAVDAGGDEPAAVRILYVQERFPILSETFVRNEVARLRTLGTAASVASARFPLEFWASDAPLTSDGSKSHTTPFRCALAHMGWLWREPRRYAKYLGLLAAAPVKDKPFVLLAPAIAKQGSSEAVTHVHTHFAFRGASVAAGVAALLDVSRSVTTHANDIFVQSRFLSSRLRGANVLTISDHNRAFLATRGISSTVNHCGIDVPDAEPRMARSRDVDILFVGRLVPKKGPLVLLAAVAELAGRGRHLVVQFVGDGPLRRECEELVHARRLPVTFLGSRTSDETLSAIGSARVLCLPCQVAPDGDVDGIPVVLMEAMARGTAVVTTRVSGIPELVDEQSGWVVEPGPGRVKELADAIEEALDGGPLTARRTDSARSRIARFFTMEQQALGVLTVAAAAS